MSEMRRIVAGVSGSPGGLQALRYGAWLARAHRAELVAVHAWTPPGGDLAERGHPSAYLREIWKDAARQRLLEAIDLALGGVPAGVAFSSQLRRGEAGQALVAAAAEPADVLVIGAGRRGPIGRALACRVSRYCVAHAVCPVIAVPPSPLATASQGLRGWVLRHRGMHPDELGLPTGS
jgi:nucleotide-binding universal stress UspA family protein